MATYKVKFSVSCTPYVSVPGDPGVSEQFQTYHEDVRDTLTGDHEGIGVNTDGLITYGTWADGVTTPLESTVVASGGVKFGDTTSMFIYIKHTGYLFDSSASDKLGEVSSDAVKLLCNGAAFATLYAGEAIVLPTRGLASGDYMAQTIGSASMAVIVLELD
jgi:hypothetical protein